MWGECKIDYIIYFVRNGEWGFIAPAFAESKKRLDAPEHKMFLLKRNEFLTAFHTVA